MKPNRSSKLKKLLLTQETVRQLEDRVLRDAAGGSYYDPSRPTSSSFRYHCFF